MDNEMDQSNNVGSIAKSAKAVKKTFMLLMNIDWCVSGILFWKRSNPALTFVWLYWNGTLNVNINKGVRMRIARILAKFETFYAKTFIGNLLFI